MQQYEIDATQQVDLKLQRTLSMALTPDGFGQLNESNGDLNDFSEMVRSKSSATVANLEEQEEIMPDTNKDESGKLLFPGQHLFRRKSLLDEKMKTDEQEVPVLLKKKTKWDEDSSEQESDDDSEEDTTQDATADQTGGHDASTDTQNQNESKSLEIEENKEQEQQIAESQAKEIEKMANQVSGKKKKKVVGINNLIK